METHVSAVPKSRPRSRQGGPDLIADFFCAYFLHGAHQKEAQAVAVCDVFCPRFF
jgi:hypothetical protein